MAEVDPAIASCRSSSTRRKRRCRADRLNITVAVAGAGANEEAYVTVAAVDVGILNLTRYEPPNPDDWYFGQRQLGLEIRDLYGRLIDGSLGATGKLRTGGDGGADGATGQPADQKLVAFFSGPVKLDARARRCQLRYPAVQRHGPPHGGCLVEVRRRPCDQDVIIRDPVVVTASLPRFLAPGDKAELRLDIANTDAPSRRLQAQGHRQSSDVIGSASRRRSAS
jgi:uncharacterized protein YfaS (alpha-2-macroglobulin family)